MNKPMLALIALLIILFSYSLYKFFDTHEYKEVTEYTAFKGEARENPLYAARLFFKQMGIPAKNKNDLQSIGHRYPDTNTVMILDTDRTTLSLERIEQLLTWMRNGGHLITGTNVDWDLYDYFERLQEGADEHDDNKGNKKEITECPEDDEKCIYLQDSNDPLQSVLEITSSKSVYIDDPNEEDDDELDRNDDDNENIDELSDIEVFSFWRTKDLRTFPIALSNASKKLTLSVEPYFYSIQSKEKNESRVLIEDEIFMLQRKIGKGMITLVADLSIIENQLLRETDNAEILWYLVHSNSNNKQPSAIWLFHNNEMSGLLELMWRYGWTVILPLAALLIFWLYQSLHRFGPLIPKQAIARRRLMEHIEASGQYFWKKKNKQALIDSTRQALNQRIGQLHPGWINTNEMGKVEHLAEMLDIPPKQVKHLLFNNKFEQDEDFTQLIIKLESIRRNL